MQEFNDLSEQEIELIKAFRKNKTELILETTTDENERYREWTNVKFKIENDIIKMNTSYGSYNKERKWNTSASGFYSRDFTKEDIIKIQKYFDYFLSK